MAEAAQPVLVGSWSPPFSGFPAAVAIHNGILFVATAGPRDSGALIALDGTDPERLRTAGAYQADAPCRSVSLSGGYAFLAAGPMGLEIIDVRSPAGCRRVGTYRPDGEGIVDDVAVKGDRAYLTQVRRDPATLGYRDGLAVVGVGDPGNPRRLGGLDLDTAPYGIEVSGGYAFIAGDGRWDPLAGVYRGAVAIVDVRDPGRPTRIGSCDTRGRARSAALVGQHLLVGEEMPGTLEVFAMGDPARPQRAGEIALWGEAAEVVAAGRHAYVADTRYGLQIIDIDDPANPRRVASVFPGITGVAIGGDHAFVIGEDLLRVVKVEDPTQPAAVGSPYDIVRPVLNVAISGSLAFVASRGGGLQAVDLSNPATPVLVGAYEAPGWVHEVILKDHLAFLAVRDVGLEILDVTDPAHPRLIGRYASTATLGLEASPAPPEFLGLRPSRGRGLAVSGQRLHATARWEDENLPGFEKTGLLALEVTDPATPRLLGRWESRGDVAGVGIADGRAYVPVVYFSGSAWDVLDVTDPAAPRACEESCGLFEGPAARDAAAYAAGITLNGSYAYSSGHEELRVMEVSDPTNPRRAAATRSARDGGAVALSADMIYAPAGSAGLLVFKLPPVIRSISWDGSQVKLEWDSFGPARLQSSTRLRSPEWLDLPAFDDRNAAILPTGRQAAFFRLVRP